MRQSLWCHEPARLQTYCDEVLRASEETRNAAILAFADREEKSILSVSGDVAIIAIAGTLSKSSSALSWFLGYGGTTYGEILDAIAKVAADPSVREVRLAVDSPGGNVSGLDDVWIALRALGKNKTVIAENRGLMASAAYWIASAAGKIIATSPAAETGSIGVQMVTYDFSEADKRDGIREIRIVSSNAPNKNPDPATEGGRESYQAQLDAIERIFYSRISDGRGVSAEIISEKYGRGALLIAYDTDSSMNSAFSVGMIDDVIGRPGEQKAQKVREIITTCEKGNCKTSSDPAAVAADNSNKGKKMPTLNELLAADSALKTEVESREHAAFDRGRTELAAETKKRTAQALATLEGDFPAAVKGLALRVIKGDSEPAALDGALTVYEAQREAEKARLAEEESKKTGATPPETPVSESADGEIRSETDHQAAVLRFRAAHQGRKD